MAGYTRQSSFSDGDTITAALFNNEYNQLVNAFNVSSGHTHDGSTTGDGGPISTLFSNTLSFGTNAESDIAITFNAASNDGVLTWKEDEDYFEFSDDLLIATTEKIQFRDTAIYINSSTDGQLDLVADTEIQIAATTIDINGNADISGNLGIGGNLTVTGTTTFNGGTITMGDAATDNVVFGADVDSNIIPDDDNTYDLGSSSQEWKDLYVDGIAYLDGINFNGTAITSTAAELNILDGVTSTAAELNILDGVTSTTAELNILDGVTASATDINLIDGITNGTVIASKAIITDSNKDITGGRNITISGQLAAATLDISGDVDVDGTLEADAITVNGTTLAETISDTVGAMVTSNTETNITVTYDDTDNTLDFVIGTLNQDTTGTAALATTVTVSANNSTDETIFPVFVDGATGTQGLETDTGFTYNPSTGLLTATGFSGNLTGTLQTAAQTNITSLGTLTGLTVDGDVTFTGSSSNIVFDKSDNALEFLDDAQAKFGTGNDLTIDHSSSTSVSRIIDSSGTLNIQQSGDDGQIRFQCDDGSGGVTSYYQISGSSETNIFFKDIKLGDNITANFGASNDLQIFHSGSVSNIKDIGTGILQLTTNGDAVQIYDSANTTTMARFNTGGTVTLNHAGTQKFQTTATGINVNGTTVSDAETAFSTAANTPNASLVVGNTSTTVANGEYKGAVGFARGSDTIQVRSAIVGKQTHTSANRQGLAFLVHSDTSAATLNEALLITHDSKIGIGTTSPSEILTVAGNIANVSGDMTLDVAGDIILDADGADILLKDAGTTFGELTNSSTDFVIKSTTSDKDILFKGNDGGSTITALKLDMSDAGKATFLNGFLTTGTSHTLGSGLGTDSASLEIGPNRSDNGNAFIDLVGDTTYTDYGARFIRSNGGANTSTSILHRGTGALSIKTQDAGAISFSTSDTERARISSGGRFLIGHSSAITAAGGQIPFSQVIGTTASTAGFSLNRFSADADGPTQFFVKSRNGTPGSNTIVQSGDTIGSIDFKMDDGTNYQTQVARIMAKIDGTPGENDAPGRLTFHTTADGAATVSERMRIDSSGNVGIGTTSPANLLHVVGSGSTPFATQRDVNSGGFAMIQGKMGDSASTSAGHVYSALVAGIEDNTNGAEDGYFAIEVSEGGSGSEKLRINSSGNVGIGTTSPSKSLHILNADPVIRLEDSSPSAYAEIDGAGGDLIISCDAGNDDADSVIQFKVDNSEKMRLDSTGNLGLGTTTIRQKLHQHVGDSGANYHLFTNTTTGTGTTDGFLVGIDGDENALLWNFENTVMKFTTNNTERMRIDSSGNLLINRTTQIGTNKFSLNYAGSSEKGLGINTSDSGNAKHITFLTSGNIKGTISTDGSNVAYNTSSDARLKDVTGSARGLEVINELNPVAYNWKANGKADEGLIAQEVLDVVPNAVSGSEEDMYQMDYSKLVVHLVAGMKEQQEQIEALQSEINELKNS